MGLLFGWVDDNITARSKRYSGSGWWPYVYNLLRCSFLDDNTRPGKLILGAVGFCGRNWDIEMYAGR